jgi:hypothetical protein
MVAEIPSSKDLLVIELTAAEMASVDTSSINDRIRHSTPSAILIYQEGQPASISVEKALSCFRAGGSINIIALSANILPLLFTRRAWRELGEFQGEVRPAKEVCKDFLSTARKARLFTVMQINA